MGQVVAYPQHVGQNPVVLMEPQLTILRLTCCRLLARRFSFDDIANCILLVRGPIPTVVIQKLNGCDRGARDWGHEELSKP